MYRIPFNMFRIIRIRSFASFSDTNEIITKEKEKKAFIVNKTGNWKARK